jgi:hypothetical protein
MNGKAKNPEMTEMGRSIRFFGYGFLTNAADASAPRDWGQYFSSITGEGKHHGLLN